MANQAAGVYQHGVPVTEWPAHGGLIPVHGGLSPVHGSNNADIIYGPIPSYLASGTQDGLNGTGTLPSLAMPAGVQAGDVVICQFASRIGSSCVVNTSGWTLLGFQEPFDGIQANDRRTTLYGRRLTGSEGATISVDGGVGGSFPWNARTHAFRGCATVGSYLDDIDGAAEQGVAMVAPSLDITGENRLIVGFSSIDACSGYANANLANITERTDVVTNGGGMSMWTAERAAPGATGPTTLNGPNDDGVGLMIIALKPTEN